MYCDINPYLSRVCDWGTKCCTLNHGEMQKVGFFKRVIENYVHSGIICNVFYYYKDGEINRVEFIPEGECIV